MLARKKQSPTRTAFGETYARSGGGGKPIARSHERGTSHYNDERRPWEKVVKFDNARLQTLSTRRREQNGIELYRACR